MSIEFSLPEDKFNESSFHLSAQFLKQFRDSSYSIAPWTESDFWYNIRNQKFSEIIFLEMIALAEQNLKKISSNFSINKLPQPLAALLTTIIHLCVTYRRTFPKEIWSLTIDSMREKEVTYVNDILVYILQFLMKNSEAETPQNMFSDTLKQIVKNYPNELLRYSLPLFSFVSLIKQLYNITKNNIGNQSDKSIVYSSFQDLFSNISEKKTRIIILHLLKLVLTFFPGIDLEGVPEIDDYLKSFVSIEDPISTMAVDIRRDLSWEIEMPGAFTFHLLKKICKMTEVGDIPLFFNPDASYLANRFTSPLQNKSLDENIIDFVRFFMKTTLNYYDEISPEKCFDIFSKMSKHFKKKFENEYPRQESHQETHLYFEPFTVPVKYIRFLTKFDADSSNLFQIDKNKFMFYIQSKLSFKNIIDPIQAYLENNQLNFYEQNIVITGNDFLISCVLKSMILSLINDNNDFNQKVSFKFFFVPTEESRISSFISKNDPIYNIFVAYLYETISNLYPSLNELSPVYMSLIENSDNNYNSNNTWLADPSPSNILRIGIQHFLLFGNNSISVPVWRCAARIKDEKSDEFKTVIIPFMFYFNAGASTSHKLTRKRSTRASDDFSLKPKQIKISYIPFSLSNEQNETIKINEKISSISLFNHEGSSKPDLTDGTLLFQLLRSPGKTENILQDSIVRFEMKIHKSELFSAIIDDSEYKNIKRLIIDPFPPLNSSDKCFKMRFATFSPLYRTSINELNTP